MQVFGKAGQSSSGANSRIEAADQSNAVTAAEQTNVDETNRICRQIRGLEVPTANDEQANRVTNQARQSK